ncbi:MAG TPA: hypothetical protein VEA59_07140, partial [Patescibacteria group bacterium]|nr:hypothetical protein [Patescibacteria group bacterium]
GLKTPQAQLRDVLLAQSNASLQKLAGELGLIFRLSINKNIDITETVSELGAAFGRIEQYMPEGDYRNHLFTFIRQLPEEYIPAFEQGVTVGKITPSPRDIKETFELSAESLASLKAGMGEDDILRLKAKYLTFAKDTAGKFSVMEQLITVANAEIYKRGFTFEDGLVGQVLRELPISSPDEVILLAQAASNEVENMSAFPVLVRVMLELGKKFDWSDPRSDEIFRYCFNNELSATTELFFSINMLASEEFRNVYAQYLLSPDAGVRRVAWGLAERALRRKNQNQAKLTETDADIAQNMEQLSLLLIDLIPGLPQDEAWYNMQRLVVVNIFKDTAQLERFTNGWLAAHNTQGLDRLHDFYSFVANTNQTRKNLFKPGAAYALELQAYYRRQETLLSDLAREKAERENAERQTALNKELIAKEAERLWVRRERIATAIEESLVEIFGSQSAPTETKQQTGAEFIALLDKFLNPDPKLDDKEQVFVLRKLKRLLDGARQETMTTLMQKLEASATAASHTQLEKQLQRFEQKDLFKKIEQGNCWENVGYVVLALRKLLNPRTTFLPQYGFVPAERYPDALFGDEVYEFKKGGNSTDPLKTAQKYKKLPFTKSNKPIRLIFAKSDPQILEELYAAPEADELNEGYEPFTMLLPNGETAEVKVFGMWQYEEDIIDRQRAEALVAAHPEQHPELKRLLEEKPDDSEYITTQKPIGIVEDGKDFIETTCMQLAGALIHEKQGEQNKIRITNIQKYLEQLRGVCTKSRLDMSSEKISQVSILTWNMFNWLSQWNQEYRQALANTQALTEKYPELKQLLKDPPVLRDVVQKLEKSLEKITKFAQTANLEASAYEKLKNSLQESLKTSAVPRILDEDITRGRHYDYDEERKVFLYEPNRFNGTESLEYLRNLELRNPYLISEEEFKRIPGKAKQFLVDVIQQEQQESRVGASPIYIDIVTEIMDRITLESADLFAPGYSEGTVTYDSLPPEAAAMTTDLEVIMHELKNSEFWQAVLNYFSKSILKRKPELAEQKKNLEELAEDLARTRIQSRLSASQRFDNPAPGYYALSKWYFDNRPRYQQQIGSIKQAVKSS